MKPPSQSVKKKGAPKKVKPTPNDNSTTRSPSYCEHVEKLFPDSPTPKSQKISNKEACISKPPLTPIAQKVSTLTPIATKILSIEEVHNDPKISFIDEMPIFMHKYINRIVNVAGDGNCGFWAVSALLGKGEDDHKLVCHELIEELVNHKDIHAGIWRRS
ncbi:uncharacterized protein LOC131650773 [Vicia villosa]|uniref:uncharacterized protein LOC131650773 n=1 Tax=Vicia villosa TaxID=3911 RepID=UPI00273C60A6|nr:uncharacterized protein LOC131650773 [Vicia villosa]